MAKGLFESENVAAPHIEEKEIPSGITYRARFIVAGPVGYADGIYFLPQCCLDDFAWTLKGKPVVIGHQDILDEADMKKKAGGRTLLCSILPLMRRLKKAGFRTYPVRTKLT